MFAISIKQPQIYSIFRLGNPYDDRYWKPKDWLIGRRIALHATGKYSEVGEGLIVRLLGIDPSTLKAAPRSAIVGVANLAEVLPVDKTNSKWTYGPWCWRYERAIEFPDPIPWNRGKWGIWKVPQGLLDRIRDQLKKVEAEAERLEEL